MVQRQLRIVGADETKTEQMTPTERVFANWAAMTGRNLRRCVLGPKRRRLIDDWLRHYDEETLVLAGDGLAASPWHAGDNPHGRACDDIELMLRDEAHIERFAADGERLRERAVQLLEHEATRAGVVSIAPVEDPAKVAMLREKLIALAATMRGR